MGKGSDVDEVAAVAAIDEHLGRGEIVGVEVDVVPADSLEPAIRKRVLAEAISS